MYIEAWLFWVIIIAICAIFGSIIASLSAQIRHLSSKQEYESKALLSQIQRVRKWVKHYHPKCEELEDK